MKTGSLSCFLTAMVMISLVCGGCSGSKIKGLVPARGTIVFNGAPVEGATVMFAPKTYDGKTGSSSAMTDKDGKFAMTTLEPGDGVFPGEYTVTVMKDRVEGGPTLEDAKLSPDEYKKRKDSIAPMVTIRELPAKYADINASGLVAVVPEGGKKDFLFELEGEVDLTPIEQNAKRGSAPGL